MTRYRAAVAAVLLLLLAAATAGGTYAARTDDDSDGDHRIAIRDDCDPSLAAGWNPSPPGPPGGCDRKRGNVSVAEFNAELISPHADSVVGHQAWRNDPSYLVVKSGQTVRVKNAGGRPHTFTETSAFGAGANNPPPFNTGLRPATPDPCPTAQLIAAGDTVKLSGLSVGNHRFLCCLHPWMRALVKVKPKQNNDDD